MNWLTKYFNIKVTAEDGFLSYLKSTYDFDDAIIIKKDDADFITIINIIAASMSERENRPLGILTSDPVVVDKIVNDIITECKYSVIKLSRNYSMSKAYHYALISPNVDGYSISFKYLTANSLFGKFSNLNGFEYYYQHLMKIKNYRFFNNQETNHLISSYSIRFPIKKDGLLEDYKNRYYYKVESCHRDLEVIIDISENDNETNYCAKLFYGRKLLKEENHNSIDEYTLFLDEFLFPYNLTKELIDELNIPLPLQLTAEFVKSMNKDFKLTIDMLKI